MILLTLLGVRRQLDEAKRELAASLEAGGSDDAAATKDTASAADLRYQSALRSRNLLFHATRGLAAARGQALPEIPVVAAASGSLADGKGVLAALDQALCAQSDADLEKALAAAQQGYGRYLAACRTLAGRFPPGGARVTPAAAMPGETGNKGPGGAGRGGAK